MKSLLIGTDRQLHKILRARSSMTFIYSFFHDPLRALHKAEVYKFGTSSCMSVKSIIGFRESWRRGALECNMTGRCRFFKNLLSPFRKNICISIPCFGILRLQNSRKTVNSNLLYPVQEFRLKNDTMKHSTSRVALYGSTHPRHENTKTRS